MTRRGLSLSFSSLSPIWHLRSGEEHRESAYAYAFQSSSDDVVLKTPLVSTALKKISSWEVRESEDIVGDAARSAMLLKSVLAPTHSKSAFSAKFAGVRHIPEADLASWLAP